MRRAIIGLAAAALAGPAAGQAVHEVRFAVPPRVWVWGDAASAEAARGMAERSGSARFELAANSGFTIEIVRRDGLRLSTDDLEMAGFAFACDRTGLNAARVGYPVRETGARGVIVWRSPVRTAQRRGDPRSQALSFIAVWDAALLPDLMIEVRPVP